MATKANRKKAEDNYLLFQRANNAYRKKWQRVSQLSLDFYVGEQLTSEEQRQLEESGMPTFVINRITPVIEMMKYFATAKNPRWQAVGAEGSDSDVASVHADIADYCWYISNGSSLYSQVIQDSLVKGVGIFQIDIDPDRDRGLGEVVFKTIDPYNVYVDPMSRDFLYRDASYIIVKKDLTKSQLIQLFPDKIKRIEKSTGSNESGSWFSQRDLTSSDSIQPDDIGQEGYKRDGEEDEIVDCYEVYEKVKIAYMNVFVKMPPDTKQISQMQESIQEQIAQYEKELQVQLLEKEKEIHEAVQAGKMIPERGKLEMVKAQKQMENALVQQKEKMKATMMEEATVIRNEVITEAEFKLLMQDQLFAVTVQDAIKFYDTRIKQSVTLGTDELLYEAVLPSTEYPIIPIPYLWTGTPYPISAVTPLVGKQQEVNKAHQLMVHNANLASNLRWLYEEGSVPEEEWEQYSSSPGALLKYRSGFSPPTPVQPSPLNAAFFQITQEGKQDMEYMSGIYSSMQGAGEQSHDTYRGMLAVDEHGTRRMKAWMKTVVEPALEQMGKVFKQIAQATYTSHKIFKIVQPSSLKEEKEVEINVPIYNDLGKAIGKWNNYESGQFDVRIVPGSTMPINRWALIEEYFRWFQAGLIDDIAMLAETDVKGKENIIKRKSIYSQLKSQVDSLEEALSDKEGTIETLTRQLVQAGIKGKVQQADQEVQKSTTETKGQQKLLQKRMQDEANLSRREVGLAAKEQNQSANK
ncbi:hypothetical protein CMI37_28980 [Candidatus Pacearchaeota archaeon]|nr:hypothetical protein [Candidatus Pacearchaeota archaeon]